MSFVTAADGTKIFYKDWGPKSARPIVFHHGWPLSSDDWDAQMLYFANRGGAKAHHDGIEAFSETDFTEDLKAVDVPTLVLHGDDDQVVPIADSALLCCRSNS